MCNKLCLQVCLSDRGIEIFQVPFIWFFGNIFCSGDLVNDSANSDF